MMPTRSLVATILTATAVALGGSSPAAIGGDNSGRAPDATLPAQCSDQQVAPASVVVLCGDAGIVADGLVWHDWGAARTSASGTASVNTCEPSCAAGNREEHPITLAADRLVDCTYGRPQYTRLTYSLQKGAGPAVQATVPFACPQRPHADPQIRRMRVSLSPGTHDVVRTRLSVCAVRGNLLAVIKETRRLGGRTPRVHRRTREFRQNKRCQWHASSWKLGPELRGAGAYRVSATVRDDDGQSSKAVFRTVGSKR